MEVGQITSVRFFGSEKFAIGKIMQGGMGRVYQLVPIRADGHPCALKTLQGVMTERDFERECNAWLSVAQHDNIAHAFAFGKWEGSPAIIVDWYPGSMAELTADECSDDYLVTLVRGLISALSFAYTKAGLIHQDIKPGNILIDKYGAARLSDFGLARCVKTLDYSTAPRNWQETTSLAQLQGPNGTPFYMAPELFAGATPSIKTDLFSLGVTIFQFLTQEHPYFGPETKGRYSSRLRYEVLARIIAARGRRLSPLVELICTCLSLDPSERPTSYHATGWLDAKSTSREAGALKSLTEINAAVGQAMFYRECGDFTKAEAVLRDRIKALPEEPILLNALGALAVKRGQGKVAFALFSEAFERLRQTAGIRHGGLYPDPGVNLAGQLLASHKHADAHLVLRTVWGWIDADLAPATPTGLDVPAPDGWYSEFGWMFLYTGDFVRAADYLRKVLSKKGLDQTSTYWLTESAWLGNRMNEHADFLVRSLLQCAPTDAAAALCGCLAAQFANSQLAGAMVAVISGDCRREISRAEKDARLGRDMLLHPTTLDAQKLIVRSVDDLITGGKHGGLVR
jgi:hypothetical protein